MLHLHMCDNRLRFLDVICWSLFRGSSNLNKRQHEVPFRS